MSIREGNWPQLGSCRLLQYGLSRRFSTSGQTIFRRVSGPSGAPYGPSSPARQYRLCTTF